MGHISKSFLSSIAFFSITLFRLSSLELEQREFPHKPCGLAMIAECYPDLKFEAEYDNGKDDWRIEVARPVTVGSAKTKSMVFYWADAKMLPEDALKDMDGYLPILYKYEKSLKKPMELTEEEIEALRDYGTTESQKSSLGSAMFFFDFLYDAYSPKEIERRIVKTTFLGCKTKLHERIIAPIRRVEKKIYAQKNDPKVKNFLDSLATTDAYFWRVIANTTRKSFHSYGIAVDCLPKRLYGKQTYWSWAKSKYGDNWMLTPMDDRWMPPKKVVEIFESEGFIWGGKWGIWDTMHFEYHPELIKYNRICD